MERREHSLFGAGPGASRSVVGSSVNG